MMLFDECKFIPYYVTYKSLHGTNFTAFNPQGNGFDGFPLNLTELADEVPVQILARLASRETLLEFGKELSELRGKSLHILFYE
jgi:hypothetical protein